MIIRNWREQTPHVGHESAVTWMYFSADYDESWHNEPCCLQGIEAIARQAVQGRKNSDYHVHEDMEQLQYVLSGTGIMRLDDSEYAIQPGDAIYIPPNVQHQFINNTENWTEFLIISCMVEKKDAGETTLELPLDEIQGIIGNELPNSAYEYDAFWRDRTRGVGESIVRAGWQIQTLERDENNKIKKVGLQISARQSRTIKEIEKEAIVNALQETGGDKTEAARQLGMPLRTFYRKMTDFNIKNESSNTESLSAYQ